MQSGWTPRNAPDAVESVEALAAFVASAVAEAFKDSPL
jgi:hypothetical protein